MVFLFSFVLTQNGKTACSKLLLDELDGLLKGAIGCSRNLLPVCSQAQLRFKRFYHLFIRSV